MRYGFLLFLFLLSNCATAPAIRYYHIPTSSIGVATASELRLGIGPIRLPPYLDRDTIILSQQQSELKLAEYSEWAGPLDDNITTVLGQALSILLGTERIARYPWPPETQVDYRIEVEIIEFHAIEDQVRLNARWSLKDKDRKLLQQEQTELAAIIAPVKTLSEPHPEAGVVSLVDAHGKVLRQLAAKIAASLP